MPVWLYLICIACLHVDYTWEGNIYYSITFIDIINSLIKSSCSSKLIKLLIQQALFYFLKEKQREIEREDLKN